MELLKKLTSLTGVSGRERAVTDFIRKELKDYADLIERDALGNLIVYKKGAGENAKKIMSAAHIDEIGFAVIAITEKGFLKVKSVGGISIHTTHCQRIKFESGIYGTIIAESDLFQIKDNKMSHMFVDIGATSKEDALKYVRIGETASYVGELVELQNGRVMSKAFDDRIGAYILIESFKQLKDQYNDAYYVFTVQEEVGLRGAKVASQAIKPDIGMALDITGSFDVPNDGIGNAVLGEGTAIKVMDDCVICDQDIVETMIEIAKKNEIKYQLDALQGGGTDAGAIALSNDGVRCGGISIPTRNGHSPVSIVDMADVNACVDMMTAFMNEEFKF
ncbi:MAG: M20/M25/M40 family metallo-hydrolase [Sarcina sp.]